MSKMASAGTILALIGRRLIGAALVMCFALVLVGTLSGAAFAHERPGTMASTAISASVGHHGDCDGGGMADHPGGCCTVAPSCCGALFGVAEPATEPVVMAAPPAPAHAEAFAGLRSAPADPPPRPFSS